MFLTPEEIAELTGRRRRSSQVAWLRDHHWIFEVRADGRPAIARAEFDRHMVGARKSRNSVDDEPRFGALRNFG